MSTYSTNLALELIGTGEQAGVWGTTTNTNLGTLIEQSISGYVTQAVATGTDTTITIPNGSSGVARNMYIELTGTGGASTNLIVPANKKLYFIFNNSTGAVTVKVSGQTGVSVPTGKKMVLVSNGTDIVNGLNYIADFASNSATITHLSATSASITNLTLTSLVISNLSIASANITTLTSASATITNLLSTSLAVSSIATFSAGTAAAPSITTTGDTNTGIFFPAADTIAFTEGGVEAARFDSSGNLGIGTSSPAVKLQVKSSAEAFRIEGTTARGSGNIFATFHDPSGRKGYWGYGDSADNYYISNELNTPMLFLTNAVERMRLSATGDLGIGTTSPASLLEVRGTFGTATTAATISNGSAASASNIARIDFRLVNTFGGLERSAAIWGMNPNAAANNGGALVFGVSANGTATTPSEVARLDSSGNLGIGTSSPGERLDVVGGGLGVGNGTIKTVVSYTTEGIVGTTSNHALLLYANNAERARITSGGYFKASDDGAYVGAANIWHEFNQSANSPNLIVLSDNASLTNTVLDISAVRNTTNNTYYFLDCTISGVAFRLRVADSGDVTNTNNSYGAISDAKMKTDIVDAGSQWADIKAVRFRKFKMKDDPQQITQLGVVAQELEQTSPGLVYEHTDRDAEGNDLGTTTKSVKSSILLMKAAVALQEAIARIEQLEAKFAALESK
jgi:hypothetical protein